MNGVHTRQRESIRYQQHDRQKCVNIWRTRMQTSKKHIQNANRDRAARATEIRPNQKKNAKRIENFKGKILRIKCCVNQCALCSSLRCFNIQCSSVSVAPCESFSRALCVLCAWVLCTMCAALAKSHRLRLFTVCSIHVNIYIYREFVYDDDDNGGSSDGGTDEKCNRMWKTMLACAWCKWHRRCSGQKRDGTTEYIVLVLAHGICVPRVVGSSLLSTFNLISLRCIGVILTPKRKFPFFFMHRHKSTRNSHSAQYTIKWHKTEEEEKKENPHGIHTNVAVCIQHTIDFSCMGNCCVFIIFFSLGFYFYFLVSSLLPHVAVVRLFD